MKKLSILLIILSLFLLFSCNEESSEGLFQEAGLSIKKETHQIVNIVGKKDSSTLFVSTYDGVGEYNINSRSFNESSFRKNGREAIYSLYADSNNVYYTDNKGNYFKNNEKLNTTISGKRFISSYTEDYVKYLFVFLDGDEYYVSVLDTPNTTFENMTITKITPPNGEKVINVRAINTTSFSIKCENKFYSFAPSTPTSYSEESDAIYKRFDNITYYENKGVVTPDGKEHSISGNGRNVSLYSSNGTLYLINNNPSGIVYMISNNDITSISIPSLQNVNVLDILSCSENNGEVVLSVITSFNGVKSINITSKKIE